MMMFLAADAPASSPAVSAWLQIALAVIGTGTVTTLFNIIFGRRRSTAEVESIAQKTSADAIDLYRETAKDTINELRTQLADLRHRVEAAEAKAEKAEARVDLAERRMNVMGRAIAEWKARVDQLEAILRRNGIEIPPWTAPPDDLVSLEDLR